jgi:hypothetical protein
MDFKNATDSLFSRVAHGDLAKALGVSVALIRQARLNAGAVARRSAPVGWEKAALRLAEERSRFYAKLAERLRAVASDRSQR